MTAAMLDLELDRSQLDALDQITGWLTQRLIDPKQPQVFRLGGAAGSGKTTLIKQVLASFPELSIAVTTYTGKAAEVLRYKDIPSAINLHQLWYTTDPVRFAEKKGLEQEMAAAASAADKEAIRRQVDRIHPFIPADTIPYDLVIVGEASMIDGRITEDLLRYGKPVLAVGDPAQLGPILKTASLQPLFADHDMDAELTGSHRHGADLLSVIAHETRHDRGLPAEAVVADPDLTSYDAVLVCTNPKRWQMIRKIRKLRGKPIDTPVVGDELTVWSNDHTLQLFNGSTFVVAEIEQDWSKRNAYRVVTAEGTVLTMDSRGFVEKGFNEAKARTRKGIVFASFSEAMTVHKAQGSEWNRVLIAEDHVKMGEREDRVRWRYTAATRARQALHVVGDSFLSPVR